MLNFVITSRQPRVFLILAIAAALNACAMMKPAEVSGPRAGGPPYPVILTEQTQRRDSAVIAFKRLYAQEGDQSAVYLQPVTATVKSLPGKLGTPLYLPKVGSGTEMSEEETREALRRFINDWRNLIGADPAALSLVERIDQKDGTKVAKYEQRPFRYPLRGDYGKLEIHFTPDRRLLNVSSSCIPDVERLQAALAAVVPQVKSEDVMPRVRAKGITYTDSAGNQQTFQLSANTEITTSELVVYVLPSRTSTVTLEFHLAWEVALKNAPVTYVYLDALEGEIVAAR
ncbi:MAG: hypothetical protein ACR2G5_06785 [Pyrinomonadaceae bacterium]